MNTPSNKQECGEFFSAIKKRCYQAMFVNAQEELGLSVFNKTLAAFILASLFVTILETEYSLYHNYVRGFYYFEIIIAMLFGIEYIVRVWAAGCDPHYKGGRGRLRFMLSFGALIDLMAFLPSFPLKLLTQPSNTSAKTHI